MAPLGAIAGLTKPGAQGAAVVIADLIGFAALTLLALQVFVSGRWPGTTKTFGLMSIVSLHRRAGAWVLTLVVIHVVVLLVDDPGRAALLDPTNAPGRARAGMLALTGILVLGVTSVFRAQLRMTYERWRAVHVTATIVVLLSAFAHVVWVNAYTAWPVVRWGLFALIVAAALGLFWTRIARPFASALRPYRVRKVRRERGDAVTLELEPAGHGGLAFRAGQFARMKPADSPYGMVDHPFTLSSTDRNNNRPSFTVKALGDFSSTIADLEIGSEVLVDGPHGEWVSECASVRGRILIAAGIGITPAMSVLRTAAQLNDDRPHLLLYGSRRWSDVTFRDELDALQLRLPGLHVVHTLSRPDSDWMGEEGRIGGSLVRRYAPADLAYWTALVCGPGAMVAVATRTLRYLGMPEDAIQAEGFG